VGKQVEILPVIKADAYGHGALPIARELIRAGARRAAVATLEEGVELREAGVQIPIVLLGGLLPRQAPQALTYRLTPFIYDLRTAEALSQAWDREQKEPESHRIGARGRISVHLKVDTGMGRLGIPYTHVLEFLEALSAYPGIEVEGLATHLATADEPDPAFAKTQINRFRKVCDQIERTGYRIPFYHVASSAGIFSSQEAHFNMVRPGIALYGIPPSLNLTSVPPLKPVMRIKTEILFLKSVAPGTSIGYGRSFMTARESLIATLPVGYYDGYSWSLSNRGRVLVRGEKCPVVGRVCMDLCMVDVSQVPEACVGDEVVLLGNQGTQQITAIDLAAWMGTIPYEVVCSVGRRVPRIYLSNGDVICVRGQDQVYRWRDT